jgi:hypothetical protein
MNYPKIYQQLIERAKNRTIDGYCEKHHIVPRCLGGDDSKQNLVRLTAREHFIAHLLLVKIHNGNMKLVKAVAMMCVGRDERKLTNRLYGKYRLLLSQAQSKCQAGKGNSQFGTKWTHHPLTKEEKKIKGHLPVGWLLGRNKKEPKDSTRRRKRQAHLKTQKARYTEYYKIYTEVGFKRFVELTGYDKSQANLVQRFAKLVDNFVPQNGKKRGSVPE